MRVLGAVALPVWTLAIVLVLASAGAGCGAGRERAGRPGHGTRRHRQRVRRNRKAVCSSSCSELWPGAIVSLVRGARAVVVHTSTGSGLRTRRPWTLPRPGERCRRARRFATHPARTSCRAQIVPAQAVVDDAGEHRDARRPERAIGGSERWRPRRRGTELPGARHARGAKRRTRRGRRCGALTDRCRRRCFNPARVVTVQPGKPLRCSRSWQRCARARHRALGALLAGRCRGGCAAEGRAAGRGGHDDGPHRLRDGARKRRRHGLRTGRVAARQRASLTRVVAAR